MVEVKFDFFFQMLKFQSASLLLFSFLFFLKKSVLDKTSVTCVLFLLSLKGYN